MATIQLPFNWRPRPYQMPLWSYLENGGKRACEVWHRRAGKDEVALHWAATAAHIRPATYWHMLPEASQARKAIWDAVNPHTGRRRIDEAFPEELRSNTRENEMMIKFKSGATWQVVGSDNYNSLVGSGPKGIVFSEWSLADPRAWAYIRPILAENDGWALFIYTPRGDNHGLSLYEEAINDPLWHAQKLTVDDTGLFDKQALAQERKESMRLFGPQTGEAYFRQEYYCSFDSAIVGSYYGHLLEDIETERRICRVPVEKGFLVNTAWDLGVSDHTVIWFYQMVGREIRIVDFYANAGEGLEHYAEVMREKGYRYGTHIWPHDGGARELGTGRTREETMRSFGIGSIRVLKQDRLEDGIQAVRKVLPRCFFDKEKTEEGFKALKRYRRKWDEERKVFLERPEHDWTSHPADAFRYLAMGMQEPASGSKAKAKPQREWVV